MFATSQPILNGPLVPFRTIHDLEPLTAHLTVHSLAKLMRPLCKHPVLGVRDPTRPEYFRQTMTFLANHLREIGLEGLGDGRDGSRDFLQSFWFEPICGDHTPCQSWNVVARHRARGPCRETVLVVVHVDALSAARRKLIRDRKGLDLSLYEGAGDNAGAVAISVEIARVIAGLEDLKKDVVFLFTSAEEEGFCGARAFLHAMPFPDHRLRGVINFELTGFGAPQELRWLGGNSPQDSSSNVLLQNITRSCLRVGHSGIVNHAGHADWGRSDHAAFAAEGFPSVVLMGKSDPSRLHHPSDVLENFNLATAVTAARLGLVAVLDLARDEKSNVLRGPTRPSLWRKDASRVHRGEDPPRWKPFIELPDLMERPSNPR